MLVRPWDEIFLSPPPPPTWKVIVHFMHVFRTWCNIDILAVLFRTNLNMYMYSTVPRYQAMPARLGLFWKSGAAPALHTTDAPCRYAFCTTSFTWFEAKQAVASCWSADVSKHPI